MIDSSYCLIIPDRGDRPMFTNLLLKRLACFKDQIIHVNYAPKSNGFDLIDRIRHGCAKAIEGGFEKAFIVENDDYYPLEYFQPFESDFVGYSDTIYYHLKNKTWEKTFHPNHSSLFTTAFRLKALEKFRWPKPYEVFLDIGIWKHAFSQQGNYQLMKNSPCVGIKHGIGLCGGMGHRQTFPNKDPQMNWLWSKVDEESFEVYKNIK